MRAEDNNGEFWGPEECHLGDEEGRVGLERAGVAARGKISVGNDLLARWWRYVVEVLRPCVRKGRTGEQRCGPDEDPRQVKTVALAAIYDC